MSTGDGPHRGDPAAAPDRAGEKVIAFRRELVEVEARVGDARARAGDDGAFTALLGRLFRDHAELTDELARRNAARIAVDLPDVPDVPDVGSVGDPGRAPSIDPVEDGGPDLAAAAPAASAAGAPGAPAVPSRRSLGATASDGTRREPPPLEVSLAAAASTPLVASREPVVSIIIPMFNHAADTARCLASLAAAPPATPFEVLVVDDCSTDRDVAALSRVAGVQVLRTEFNGGFIRACNAGAAGASGALLFFLNNDTEVRPGAIDAMVGTFADRPEAGVVGAKLLWADGSMQDGGGILFADGSAWNFGRGGDATAPEVSYVREADYVSGAALMVRRRAFEDSGGFAEYLVPAYFEDPDLCMQVRAKGMKVLYQPFAEVVHHEGTSYGTGDRADQKRAQMARNQERFLARWRDALLGHGERGVDLSLVKDRWAVRRVLVVDATMIQPDHDAGSLRMAHILRLLQEAGSKVTFVPANGLPIEPYASDLRASGVEVVANPHFSALDGFLRERGSEFDVVVLSRLEVAGDYIRVARRHCPRALLVFDTVDLHFLRESRQAAHAGDAIDMKVMLTREAEIDTMGAADVTLVCSTAERDFLGSLHPDLAVDVLSLVHDEPRSEAPLGDRRDLLFVGGFAHPPNADAVKWFVAEVLPLVNERAAVRLHVVGSSVPDEITALASDVVQIRGFVSDLGPLYDSARLVVAPLRFGAGVKGKVIQSLMTGVPVVGTSIAVEGTPIRDGVHALVADTAHDFADAVVRLVEDDDLWRTLADGGREVAETTFGVDAARAGVQRLLARAEPGRT